MLIRGEGETASCDQLLEGNVSKRVPIRDVPDLDRVPFDGCKKVTAGTELEGSHPDIRGEALGIRNKMIQFVTVSNVPHYYSCIGCRCQKAAVRAERERTNSVQKSLSATRAGIKRSQLTLVFYIPKHNRTV